METSDDGRNVISPSYRRFTLDELVEGITPDREHQVDDDPPRGEELL
jgi:antitoxin component of MazEF toxin-antitoxin module